MNSLFESYYVVAYSNSVFYNTSNLFSLLDSPSGFSVATTIKTKTQTRHTIET